MKAIEQIPVLPRRRGDAHKGHFGRVLILGGSQGMLGAACLAASACLRSGAGLATLGVPKSLANVAAAKMTCVMTKPFSDTPAQSFSSLALSEIIEFAAPMDVVAIGPGLSQNPDTQKLVRELVSALAKPVVIDADGLNALVAEVDILKKREAPTIITPHPGEFARLARCRIGDLSNDRLDKAAQFAIEYKCVVVLKFAPTIVTDGKCYYYNTTGNPGMASGGSGDVLTGVITALLAQRLYPFAASQLGVWVHGRAGDIACQDKGEIGMIASDIVAQLPYAFQTVPVPVR